MTNRTYPSTKKMTIWRPRYLQRISRRSLSSQSCPFNTPRRFTCRSRQKTTRERTVSRQTFRQWAGSRALAGCARTALPRRALSARIDWPSSARVPAACGAERSQPLCMYSTSRGCRVRIEACCGVCCCCCSIWTLLLKHRERWRERERERCGVIVTPYVIQIGNSIWWTHTQALRAAPK